MSKVANIFDAMARKAGWKDYAEAESAEMAAFDEAMDAAASGCKHVKDPDYGMCLECLERVQW